MLISPLLRLRETEVAALGDGAWRVRARRREHRLAADQRHAEGLRAQGGARRRGASSTAGEGVERRRATAKLELGQLAGRVGKHSMLGGFGGTTDATTDRAKAEWVVRGPAGSVVNVEIRHQRAGIVHAELTLG